MLEIKNLSVEIDGKEILHQFHLLVPDHEIHALMGPNGVGKSTICKVIMHDPNYTIKEGEILWNGTDLLKLDTTEIARKKVFLLSQNPIAVEGVTNAEMLRMALAETRDEPMNIFAFQKELESICAKLDIPKEFIHREINVGMSGGERKKNELLQLWMLKPELVLLDEIDSGLDVDALKIVATSLKEYADTTGATILVITHHKQILDILKPNRIHILKDKKIMTSGDASLAEQLETSGYKSLDEAFQIDTGVENE